MLILDLILHVGEDEDCSCEMHHKCKPYSHSGFHPHAHLNSSLISMYMFDERNSIFVPKFISLTWMQEDQDYKLKLGDPWSPTYQDKFINLFLLGFTFLNHVSSKFPTSRIPNV